MCTATKVIIWKYFRISELFLYSTCHWNNCKMADNRHKVMPIQQKIKGHILWIPPLCGILGGNKSGEFLAS